MDQVPPAKIMGLAAHATSSDGYSEDRIEPLDLALKRKEAAN